MSVRIVDVCEITKPISSPIRNAYIDFTKMTTSLVAVVTDVVRDGARWSATASIPTADRAGRADPRTLRAAAAAKPIRSRCSMRWRQLDPDKVWATMMSNEKPGGHGERSVAVGTIDMAVWDAVAKIAGKPLFVCSPSVTGATADPRVFVYAAGGYYYPGKDLSALRGEMRGYLDRGYNVVKMKIGGAPIAEDRERIEAVLKEIGKRRSLPSTPTAGSISKLLSPTPKCCASIRCSGTRRRATPSISRCRPHLPNFIPGPMATGENLFSHQDARNLIRYGGMRPDRDWLQFDCALSYGLCEYQRTLVCCRPTAGRRAAAFRMAAIRCRSISPPASASAATRAIPTCFSPMAVFRTAFASRTATSPCRIFRASVLRENPISTRR